MQTYCPPLPHAFLTDISSDINAVMEHPFFAKVHWGERHDLADAPLQPSFRVAPAARASGKEELRAVQAALTAARKEDQAEGRTLILTEQDQALYKDFDYVDQSALTAELLGWLERCRNERDKRAEGGESCCVQ